ncbi:hypothetical protein Y032_0002g1044 [Ancylostoma ceylanicum]|nr:hypothetical protein Y032_0002g1044 [Ancylostoma ceylanicum]
MHLVVSRQQTKKNRAMITHVAQKVAQGCSLSFRWSLDEQERAELKGGTAMAVQRSMLSVSPRQTCGLNIVAGNKWLSWAETIASARNDGREDLAQIIGRSANSALAQGTMEAYSSMRRRFADFSASFTNANSNLGKYRNLFIAHLIHMGQLKSIPIATAALNFFYGRLDDGDAELQKLLVDSAKRETPPIVHRKKASQEDIDAIVDWALTNESDETITESSIVLLSFLAFLRIGETACVRKKDLEDKGNGTWWVRIPKSKTDQRGLGSTVAFKIQGKVEEIWRKFMKVLKKIKGEQFIFATQSGNRPTTDALRKRISAVLNRAGLGHKGLTPHSFRGGAATVALRNGANQEDIKRVGRWKSTSALLHYIEPTPL